jgi:hypothetical protein
VLHTLGHTGVPSAATDQNFAAAGAFNYAAAQEQLRQQDLQQRQQAHFQQQMDAGAAARMAAAAAQQAAASATGAPVTDYTSHWKKVIPLLIYVLGFLQPDTLHTMCCAPHDWMPHPHRERDFHFPSFPFSFTSWPILVEYNPLGSTPFGG